MTYKFFSLIFVLTCSTSYAKPLKLFFTNSMPPYLYENRTKGLELDIIKEAMRAANIEFNLDDNVNYNRGILELKHKYIDAMVVNKENTKYREKIGKEIYFSDTSLHYLDCTISLKKKNFKLDNIDNFIGKSIWAFQSAKEVLGSKFKKMALSNPRYTEENDQKNQASMLASERLDIAISDKNIFLYQLNKLDNKKIGSKDFSFQPIAKPTPRAVIFIDKSKRNKFNRGLKKIKQNGVYNKIRERYKKFSSHSC